MELLALVLLFVGHYLGDYTHLSTKWMLDAKRLGEPVYPIFIHALIHALFVFIIAGIFSNKGDIVVRCFVFELLTHWIIDILKGRLNAWVPSVSQPQNKAHWYIFGLDQLLHQIVLIGIWYNLFR